MYASLIFIILLNPFSTKYLMRGDTVLKPNGCMSQFDYGLMLGHSPSVGNNISRNLREAATGIHLLDTSILRNKFASTVSVNGLQVRNSPNYIYALKS